MIKIEITGTDPQELYTHAAVTLGWLVHGAQVQAQQALQAATTAAVASGDGGEALANPTMEERATETRKRGRPRKIEIIEVPEPAPIESTTVTVLQQAELIEPLATTAPAVADVLGDPEHTYTLDDIRTRTAAILDAHRARGHDMATCMDYVRELFKPFEIRKAVELPAARYAEYMRQSVPYLDGTNTVL